MNEPLVSIIIPTYHRNKLLYECLESIQKCKYKNVETIVVDGAKDHANEVVSKFDARHVPQSIEGGASAARTQGINRATGKYIHFLDDDDRMIDGAISKKVKLLENDQHVGVAYSGVVFESGHNIYSGFSQKEHIILPKKNMRGEVLKEALAFQLVPCSNSTLLIRRELLNKIFPLEGGPKDDSWMVVELAQKTKFDFIEEPLIYRNDPDDSEGRTFAAVNEHFLIMKEKSKLYDKFPEHVRLEALADTYELRGLVYLEKNKWSFFSIISFAKAFYYKPGFSITYLGMFLASIFGSYVWFAVARMYVELFVGDKHTGNF